MMWWSVVCALGAAGAVLGEPAPWLGRISDNFQSDIAELLRNTAQVEYSSPPLQTHYVARVDFDYRAMGPLYNVTPFIIDTIADKQAYPPGVVSVSGDHVDVAPLQQHWRAWLAHYAGPAAVVAAALLALVALPFAGLIWCCCRMCRSKRRRRPFDRKYDGLLKGFLAIVFIALITLFLFGVVCLFATQQQAAAGVAAAPAAAAAAAADVQLFLNNTAQHARWLLVNNYQELHEKLNAVLTSAGMTVSVYMGQFSHQVSVSTLNAMVQQLDAVHDDLAAVERLTRELREHGDSLDAGIRKVKHQLIETLWNCTQEKCLELQKKYEKIAQLSTNIHYSQMLDKYFPTMPDVSELMKKVSALLQSDLRREVAAGQRVFQQIKLEMQRAVDQKMPALHRAVDDLGKKLEGVSDSISAQCAQMSAQVARHEGALQAWWQGAAPHAAPPRAATLGAAAVVTAIATVFTLGVVCGVCGRRPDVYGSSDCCSKGVGAKCLVLGIVVIFVAGAALLLVFALLFSGGVLAQRFLCDPFTSPRDSRLFSDLEALVQLEAAVFHRHEEDGFNMSAVLARCHRNLTVYQVLHLHRLYDVSSLSANLSSSVSASLSELQLRFPARDVTILSAAAKTQLNEFAASGLSDFDFDRIIDALESNLTSLPLAKLSQQLSSTASSLAPRPGYSSFSSSLGAAAARLQRLQREHVEPLLEATAQLNLTALRLRDGLKFNSSSHRAAVLRLMNETSDAETFLNRDAETFLRKTTAEFGSAVSSLLEEYLSRVSLAARRDVARCGPLSNVYNATTAALCTNILLPLNGYWISLAWCILLLLPLLLVSQKLATLYRQLEPYPGPLVEAEYLYDAYTDRDNVPLANAYKAEKRSGVGGARRGGGAAGAGAAVAGGAGGAADAHPRRYNDMAPKHWEEGPPRYASGPTEYERPPPYYYPGSADRQ